MRCGRTRCRGLLAPDIIVMQKPPFPAASQRCSGSSPRTWGNIAVERCVCPSPPPPSCTCVQDLIPVRWTPVSEDEPGKHMDPITKDTFTNSSKLVVLATTG